MNPFAEKYKSFTNAQLLEIIDTPDNYRQLAVEAAEDELLARDISLAEIAGMRIEGPNKQGVEKPASS